MCIFVCVYILYICNIYVYMLKHHTITWMWVCPAFKTLSSREIFFLVVGNLCYCRRAKRRQGADEGDTDGAAGGSCGKPEAYATHYSHQDKGCFYTLWFPHPPPKFISLSGLLYRIQIYICEANVGWGGGGREGKVSSASGPVPWGRKAGCPARFWSTDLFPNPASTSYPCVVLDVYIF